MTRLRRRNTYGSRWSRPLSVQANFVDDDNPVRIIEAFVEDLELGPLGFDGAMPSTTGCPSYHPAVLLKIYIYGYLNRIQSSRRLERECRRNVELMWLTGRLAPNGQAIRNVCR
jgi:transposase